MTIPEVGPFTPEIGFVQVGVLLLVIFVRFAAVERVDHAEGRTVDHRRRERAVQEEELGILVMPGQVPSLYSVERAVTQHELHVLVARAAAPDGGGTPGLEKGAVGNVTPAAWAQEIDGPAKRAARMVITTALSKPQCHRIGPVAQDVVVEQDRPVPTPRDREGVLADDPRGVGHSHVFDNEAVTVHVEDGPADPVWGLEEIVIELGELQACALAAL